MDTLMKVGILQYAPQWMQPEENLVSIAEMCSNMSTDTELVFLPEMFNTGYQLKPDTIPVSWQDTTIDYLANLADKYQITFGGSIPYFDNFKWYNAFLLINKNGLAFRYDKSKLFSLAGESEYYTPGVKREIFLYGAFKLLPLVCYDLRFADLVYNAGIPDVIIYSSNWPVQRIHHWKILLAARAIENQSYVIGINRTGFDENGSEYPGVSLVFDFNGSEILNLGHNAAYNEVILDLNALTTFRSKLPFLKDRSYC